jgi:hypothetical protein
MAGETIVFYERSRRRGVLASEAQREQTTADGKGRRIGSGD